MTTESNKWDSNITFIFAMIASAIGLGNIWRYPYVLYTNGGGAFYIPYIVALLIMAFPFLILENALGYNYQSSIVKAITNIKPKLQIIAWIMPIISVIIIIYYSVVIGWDGIYFILSFFKGWGANSSAYFSDTLLQSSQNIADITRLIPTVAISVIVVWILVWTISHRNINKGLGLLSKIMIPTLFVLIGIFVAFSLTLPGAGLGLKELFSPDWSLLLKPSIWISAFGQMFFSLSLGTGELFTFASYTDDNVNLVSSAKYVVLGNCLFENIAAIGVFSILGNMSLTFGTPVSQLVSEGSGLLFIAYPSALNLMGIIGLVLGPLLFFMIYAAGITTLIASFEVVSSSIQDKFAISRKKATGILCIACAALSLIFTTAPGELLLRLTDRFVNDIGLILIIFIESLIYTWIFKIDRIVNFLNFNDRYGKIWIILVKFATPLILIIMWLGSIIQLISEGFNNTTFIFIILSAITLILAVISTKTPARSKDWLKVNERIKS